MNRVLKFKIWGDYAHFKKYYTTTSPLTFEFPPPPTIAGIVSAIIGLDKNEYLQFFENENDYKVAIKISSPVKKVRWTQNLIETKFHFWHIKRRTQIRLEFLKDAAFTIYFYHKNMEIYETLKQFLQKHTTTYTISLGLSELLADFEFLGEFEVTEKTTPDWIEINTVFPAAYLQDANSLDFGISRKIFKINFPLIMNKDRIVTKREFILFENNGKPIKCKIKKYWETKDGERIVFL